MPIFSNSMLLFAVKTPFIGNQLYMKLCKDPNYGATFEMGAMAWQLYTDANKEKLKEHIKKSQILNKFFEKLLIFATLADYAPKIDLNDIPQQLKQELINFFDIKSDIDNQSLISELNSNEKVEVLLKFISDNEKKVVGRLNSVSTTLDALYMQPTKRGGYKTQRMKKNKINKKKRSLKYMSRKRVVRNL